MGRDGGRVDEKNWQADCQGWSTMGVIEAGPWSTPENREISRVKKYRKQRICKFGVGQETGQLKMTSAGLWRPLRGQRHLLQSLMVLPMVERSCSHESSQSYTLCCGMCMLSHTHSVKT